MTMKKMGPMRKSVIDEMLGFLAEKNIPLRLAIIALTQEYEKQEAVKVGNKSPKEKAILPKYQTRGG